MIKPKIALISLAITLLGACGESTERKHPDHLQAPVASQVGQHPAHLQVLADSQEHIAHRLALNLYDRIATEAGSKAQQNFVFSPTSIAMSLGMLHAGANGTTREQIARALIPAGDDLVPVMLQQLVDSLSMRSELTDDSQTPALELSVSNTVWLAPELQPFPAYLEEVAERYQAESHLLDFIHAPEEARLTINDAVSDSTNGMIKDLLHKDSVTRDTRLILTNTIYFSGNWRYSFIEGRTAPMPFYNLDRPASQVETMQGIFALRYHQYENAQVAAIAYTNADLEMIIIVPDEGQFHSVEAGLDSTTLSQLMASLAPARMTVQLPKFSFDHNLDLRPALQSLGVIDAFSRSDADLSRLSAEHLHVGVAKHKAAIAVDERGTEAAAASALEIGIRSLPAGSITVDRPFIFGIYDRPTDTFLFLGRILSL